MKRLLRNVFLLLIVTCTLAEEEVNPFVEAAKSLLKDQLKNRDGGGLGAIAGIVKNFMQSESGKHIGDMIKNGDLLSSFASLLDKDSSDSSSGGIDPQLISSMLGMMAGSNEEDNSIQGDEPKQQQVDWGSMLSLASGLLGGDDQGEGAGNGVAGLLNILPMLLQAGGSNTKETGRESAFAPLKSILSDYWSHFTNSELGKTVWESSGMKATIRLFTNDEGNLDVERIYKSLENASFRKRWVRSLSAYVSEWITHLTNPATQQRYLTTAQFMGNGFLKAQGYQKSLMFDPQKPAESLSKIANAIAKRHFGLNIDSGTYIKPAVSYIQEVFKLGQAKGLSLSHLSSKEIEGKLTDTISGEVIEPVMRVWRAYRFAVRNPKCDRYIMCTVNQKDTAIEGGFKPGVTKLSSLAAIWYLSGNTGTPIWKLYNAAVSDHDCPVQYPADCSEFHEEDTKATTEYAHSEL